MPRTQPKMMKYNCAENHHVMCLRNQVDGELRIKSLVRRVLRGCLMAPAFVLFLFSSISFFFLSFFFLPILTVTLSTCY